MCDESEVLLWLVLTGAVVATFPSHLTVIM